jgi:hypothetical protein
MMKTIFTCCLFLALTTLAFGEEINHRFEGGKPSGTIATDIDYPPWLLRDLSAARLGFPDSSFPVFGEGQDPQTLERFRFGQVSPPLTFSGSDPSIDTEKLGNAMANPLSYLWMMFAQNDTTWYDGDIADDLGEGSKVQNTTLIMPVLSLQLTTNWKTIIRPVIPINSFETVDNVTISTDNADGVTGVDFDRKTGLGDIVLWTAFSNQYKPPFVYGFGPTVMMNTATHDQLGTGKWSAGPMGLAVSVTEKWIVGGVVQHWWSFAGEDRMTVNTNLGKVRTDRPDVNLSDVQPIIRYRLSPVTNIGMAPNVRYNWETDQLSLPLGGGGDTLVMFGALPVKVGFEAYYYVERDKDFGPVFQFRFLFVPILPAPEWSRTPIF